VRSGEIGFFAVWQITGLGETALLVKLAETRQRFSEEIVFECGHWYRQSVLRVEAKQMRFFLAFA
jgi:hypothetical protein